MERLHIGELQCPTKTKIRKARSATFSPIMRHLTRGRAAASRSRKSKIALQ
jgi:hypothetical protein